MKHASQEELSILIKLLEENIDSKYQSIHNNPSPVQEGVKQEIVKEEALLRKLKDQLISVKDKPASQMPIRQKQNNLLFMVFAVLGTLFVASGILFIFAYNWSNLSKPGKIIISLLPLIFCQAMLLWSHRKNKSTIWTESLSLGVTLSLVIASGLIAQTLQITVPTENLFFISLLFSFPLIYLFKTKYTALFYMMCTIYICFEGPLYMNVLGVLMAYYFYELVKNKVEKTDLFKVLYLYWGLQFILRFTEPILSEHTLSLMLFIIIILLISFNRLTVFRNIGIAGLLGLSCYFVYYYQEYGFGYGSAYGTDYGFITPIMGYEVIIGILVIIGLMSWAWFFKIYEKDKLGNILAITSSVLLVFIQVLLYGFAKGGNHLILIHMYVGYILFAIYVPIIVAYYSLENNENHHEKKYKLISVALFISILLYFFNATFISEYILLDALIVIVTVFYIVFGIKKEISWLYKLNIFLINLFLVAKVIESDFGLMIKGLFCIGAGIIFLVTNYYLLRRERRNSDETIH